MEPWVTVVIGIVLLLAAYWYFSRPADPSAAGTDSASSDTSADASADTTVSATK